MFKKILVVLGVIFVFGMIGLFYVAIAEDTQQNYEKAVNVGNKVCPVSGDKIDEKMRATYEYNGRIYNFCCTACIEDFKKDPEKYIKKVEEELKVEKDSQSKTGEEHEGHQHSAD